MNDNNNSRLNIVLENGHTKKDDGKIFISLFGIFKNLKRFFAIWLALTIIVSILAILMSALIQQDSYKKMTALVSFTYNGVEKGLDPKGQVFNINSMKSPQIIEEALEEYNINPKKLESIRKNISFRGIVSKNDAEKLTAYKDIYSGAGINSMTAIKKMLENKIYYSQYIVAFDYAPAGLSSNEAASLLNTILEKYSKNFLEAYGYNKPLGNSLTTLEYTDYDYIEAVDMFESNLDKLSKYVSQLSSGSGSTFRSSVTGYSFRDLNETISTVKSIYLDRTASYININTVTKDRDKLRAYYQYRIEKLERHQTVCRETLASANASIKNYQQNTNMIFGNEVTENMDKDIDTSTAQYDKLFEQVQSIQDDLSETTQKIDRYRKRIEKLNSPVDSVSAAQIARVEEEIENLNEQTEELINLVNETAEDYYNTIVFAKSYNILVPANSSNVNLSQQILKGAIVPVILADAAVFILFFAASVILSCIEEYAKSNEKEKNSISENAIEATE